MSSLRPQGLCPHLFVRGAARAVAAGAEVEMPVREMFWGERYGVLRDPFGHRWAVTTAREQLTPDEIVEGTEARPYPPSPS
ncbi:VOC family protein [Nonomuraea insulae]|uniref:VOC family protein n=1 Tax=Nonomuraea insulae TaxID=1616787 RepID=A0ABW1CMG1_9ACTN